MKIVLAGGNGFLGRVLARWFAQRGDQVVAFTRKGEQIEGARTVRWNGVEVGDWAKELEGADILINLAGRSVNCRYTPENQKEIMDSRVLSTRALGKAIAGCANPPRLWINSSTATIYKHTYRPAHTELGATGADPAAKDEFSIKVARAWEEEFANAKVGCRKVLIRSAMVFGRQPGTVFQVLRRLTRFGLGGKMGSGKQFVSWIHENDFCRATQWLIDHQNAEGVYNVSAPNPVLNEGMMRIFRESMGMPIGLPATEWMLELGAFFLRTETELIIKSRNVLPDRLMREGFTFNFPQMRGAVEDLLGPEKG